MNSQQKYKRFDILSDSPMQVNQLDYSKPLGVLPRQQQVDALSGLEVRGIQTQNVLNLISIDPYTYILQIDFHKPSMSKMPLQRVLS